MTQHHSPPPSSATRAGSYATPLPPSSLRKGGPTARPNDDENQTVDENLKCIIIGPSGNRESGSETAKRSLSKKDKKKLRSASKSAAQGKPKPPVGLSEWCVVVPENSKYAGVIVEGMRTMPGGEQRLWHSSLIARRDGPLTVATASGTVYQLQGEAQIDGRGSGFVGAS